MTHSGLSNSIPQERPSSPASDDRARFNDERQCSAAIFRLRACKRLEYGKLVLAILDGPVQWGPLAMLYPQSLFHQRDC